MYIHAYVHARSCISLAYCFAYIYGVLENNVYSFNHHLDIYDQTSLFIVIFYAKHCCFCSPRLLFADIQIQWNFTSSLYRAPSYMYDKIVSNVFRCHSDAELKELFEWASKI